MNNKQLNATGIRAICPYCKHVNKIDVKMSFTSEADLDIKPLVYVTCAECTREMFINIASTRNEYEEAFIDIVNTYSESTGKFAVENECMLFTDRRCFGIEFPKNVYDELRFTLPEGWAFIPVERDGAVQDTYYIGPAVATVDPADSSVMYNDLIEWAKEQFYVEVETITEPQTISLDEAAPTEQTIDLDVVETVDETVEENTEEVTEEAEVEEKPTTIDL